MHLSELKIDLRQMIMAVETAVSLVGMNDTNHGKRVGYIACQLGNRLGFSDYDIQFLFELGLLHDCGVSTHQMHSSLVNHFDWIDAHTHCEVGHQLLKDFEPLSKFAAPILYHHTRWDSFKDLDLTPYVADMANLIFLADRIDVMAASHYSVDILLARIHITESISQYAGTYFNPAFVEAFKVIEDCEAFWIALEDRHITRYTWDMGAYDSQVSLRLSQIKQLSLILSYIVDQKSPFTAQHSIHVAELAKYLANVYGLSDEQCLKIEIAGLLHDLGKLHTPDDILSKSSRLNATERSIMNQHSYETYEILRHIKGLEDIALWAAYHHEGINGAGYPFHPKADTLSVEARIIAVADIFQALVQDRPYRKGLSLAEVIDVLDYHVTEGKIDPVIVNLAKKHSEKCFAIAKGDDALQPPKI